MSIRINIEFLTCDRLIPFPSLVWGVAGQVAALLKDSWCPGRPSAEHEPAACSVMMRANGLVGLSK